MSASSLEQLLDLLQIERVVVVDDQFLMTAGQFLLAFTREEAPTLSSLPDCPEGADWDDHIEAAWEQVSTHDRVSAARAAAKQDDYTPPDPTRLRALIGSRTFKGLTMHEWEQEREKLMRTNKRTLLLFDVNFSGETGKENDKTGLALAREALAADSGPQVVGLLTDRAQVGKEEEQAAKWARDSEIREAELVVVNKKLLVDHEDQDQLAAATEQVREAMQAAQLTRLRRRVREALDAGIEEAERKLAEHSPTALEDVVFTASHEGGEWEGDTWFRLYGTLGLHAARRTVSTDAAARAAITDVRKLLIERGDPPAEESRLLAEDVERAEAYERGEYVNGAGLPLANGDIFQAIPSKTYFILVGQPCDLTVRPTGRAYEPTTVTLLPIKERDEDGESESRRSAYELPDGGPMGTGGWEVRFTPEYATALDLLDLCSFNTEGKATTKPKKGSALMPLLPGLQVRFDEINEAEQKASGLVQEIDQLLADKHVKKARAKMLREKVLRLAGPFAPTLNGMPAGYDFRCQRVGRLAGTYADGLLVTHASVRARTAHAHELTRIVAGEK